MVNVSVGRWSEVEGVGGAEVARVKVRNVARREIASFPNPLYVCVCSDLIGPLPPSSFNPPSLLLDRHAVLHLRHFGFREGGKKNTNPFSRTRRLLSD